MADKKDKQSFNNGARQPSLNDVLKTSSEANQINGSYQNRGAENGAANTPKSLDEILNKGQKKQLMKVGVSGSSSPSDLPRLDDLLNTGTNSKSSQKRDSSLRDHPAKTVHQIISSTSSEDAPKQEKRVEGVTGQNYRKIFSIAIIAVLVVIAISFFNAKQENERVPDSALAQQLMVVVNGIERYRLENNKLPGKLSDLPEFPKGAVEWKIDQYDLQLKASALEFFFWEDFSGYIVISRLGEEAWMYTDQGESKIRRVPAR
jgi:competence protein ComGC